MDRKLRWETVSLLLLLLAFPVISLGSTHGRGWLWWIGFGAVILGALLPVWTRFMDHSTDEPRDMGMEFDDRPS